MTELDPLVALDDATKPLRSRLLQVPALRARYLEHLRTLGAEMSWERMGPVVAALRATIAERIARDTRKAASTEAFERATSQEADGALRQFLERRSKFLLGYAAPVSAPTATGDGEQAPARDPVKDPVKD